MPIDPDVSRTLRSVKVVEFSTVTRAGGIRTKPMGTVWLPDAEQVVISMPIAYPQKMQNVQDSGRAALFYSDFTGSGLTSEPAVLVQGAASTSGAVLAPQDIEWYWRAVLGRNPGAAEQFASAEYRRDWGWYYVRFLVTVPVDRVHVFEHAPAGGSADPAPPEGSMVEKIKDALERYPTAVLTAKDANGYPFSVRATVSATSASERLRVVPLQPFQGRPGRASILWQRHDGRYRAMSSLLVAGSVTGAGDDWTFTAERLPGELPHGRDASSFGDFLSGGRRLASNYLESRGLDWPEIDWDALTGFAKGA